MDSSMLAHNNGLLAKWQVRNKTTTLPVIEKDVPLPAQKPDARRTRRPSPWPPFLRSLQPGDSFVAEYPANNTIRHWARHCGISITWAWIEGNGPNGRPRERFWRTADLTFLKEPPAHP